MQKPTIINISTVVNNEGFVDIYGLGDDNVVYVWFKKPGEWRPASFSPRNDEAF